MGTNGLKGLPSVYDGISTESFMESFKPEYIVDYSMAANGTPKVQLPESLQNSLAASLSGNANIGQGPTVATNNAANALAGKMSEGYVPGASAAKGSMYDAVSDYNAAAKYTPTSGNDYTSGIWDKDQLTKSLEGVVVDPKYKNDESGGLADWFGSDNGQAIMGAGLGVGNLGLGLASYLENKKTADKQRQLMDQQISNNKFVLSEAKGRQADIAKTFG